MDEVGQLPLLLHCLLALFDSIQFFIFNFQLLQFIGLVGVTLCRQIVNLIILLLLLFFSLAYHKIFHHKHSLIFAIIFTLTDAYIFMLCISNRTGLHLREINIETKKLEWRDR